MTTYNIETVTQTDLQNRVAAGLDVDLSTTSVPTTDQVDAWLWDAAMFLATVLKPDQIPSLIGDEENVTAMATGTTTLAGTNVIRPLYIGANTDTTNSKVYNPCTIYTQQEHFRIKQFAPNMHTADNPAAVVTGKQGSLSIEFYPSGMTFYNIRYIGAPSPVANWTGAAANFVPPSAWAQAMTAYAVMMGKLQDEEVELANMSKAIWETSLTALIGKRSVQSPPSAA